MGPDSQEPTRFDLVVDPDVDLNDPAQRGETAPREWDVVVAVAVGGVLGAQARYGLARALPHATRSFPWSTVLINASGCLAIAVLMVILLERRAAPPRLARPFLGVGILGGYTTYSTFATDIVRLAVAHRFAIALGYLAVTVVGCAVAVWAGTLLARRVGGVSR